MENNLPEKSSSFNKPDVHVDDINSESATSLSFEESTNFATEEKPTAAETNIKEDKSDEDQDQKKAEIENINETEDPPPSPPLEIQYTIETALEDVDCFQTTLCAPNGEDEESSLNIPEFVEKCLDIVEETILKHESGELKAKWGQLAEHDIAFLDSVYRISKLNISISNIKSDQNHSILINRICGIQQRAMSFLEDEFRILMEESRSVESEQSSGDTKAKQEQLPDQSENYNCPCYWPEILSSLNRIAKEMIAGGFESECCQVYTMARRNAFDEQLSGLGFEKFSFDDVQKMQWEALEREIPKWITAVKECATVLFSSERKLAEEIFTDCPSIFSSLFINLTRSLVIQFLNFAEAVAMTKRSAEKLFKYLDMYEPLRDSLPAIATLFPQVCTDQLTTEITTTRCRMGEAAICIFCDLENSIKSDTGKTPVPGGAVHPLTRYTVNYLKYACEYKETLEMVFEEHSKIERADSTSRSRTNYDENYNGEAEVDENQSAFSSQLMRMMDLLDANLEAKSKLYRDVSL